jgi:hypothetical protein
MEWEPSVRTNVDAQALISREQTASEAASEPLVTDSYRLYSTCTTLW